MQITDYIEGFSITSIPKCMHLLPTGELVLKGVQIGDVRFTDEVEKTDCKSVFFQKKIKAAILNCTFLGFLTWTITVLYGIARAVA